MRSKIYPADCFMLQIWFHPLSWRFRYRFRSAQKRSWHQQRDMSRWFVSVGPFTICESYLQ